jgi:hypothetical protein
MELLSEPVKRFIVQRLACYESPSQVVAAVKEVFGIEITRQRAWTYTPKSGTEISQELKDLFVTTREEYRKMEAEVGVAQLRYRMERRQKWLEILEGTLVKMADAPRPNVALLAATIERLEGVLQGSAKDQGGAFTNRHVLSGAVGSVDYSKLDQAQLERIAAGEDPARVLSGDGGS